MTKGRGGSPLSQLKSKAEMVQLFGLAEGDLKELITTSLSSVVDKIKNSQKNLVDLTAGKHDQLSQTIVKVISDLSNVVIEMEEKVTEISSKFDSQIQEIQEKFVEAEIRNQATQNDIIMLQIKTMASAIRVRGIKENQRDLKAISAKVFAELLELEDEIILGCIEKVYRVNSRIAKQRNLPRDVVVYFTDKRLRDDILQKSYSARVQVEGAQINIFKELPSKVLKDRKEFAFLTKELKRNNIPFRWDLPAGIIFRYHGVRYCLNTIGKAEHFYKNILKGASEYLKNKKQEREFAKGKQKDETQRMNQRMLKVQGVQSGFSEDFTMDFSDGKIEHTSEPRLGAPDLELLEQDLKNIITQDEQQQRSNAPQGKGGDVEQEPEFNEEIQAITNECCEVLHQIQLLSESMDNFGKWL